MIKWTKTIATLSQSKADCNRAFGWAILWSASEKTGATRRTNCCATWSKSSLRSFCWTAEAQKDAMGIPSRDASFGWMNWIGSAAKPIDLASASSAAKRMGSALSKAMTDEPYGSKSSSETVAKPIGSTDASFATRWKGSAPEKAKTGERSDWKAIAREPEPQSDDSERCCAGGTP